MIPEHKTLWEIVAGKARKWLQKSPSRTLRTALDADALIAFWWRGEPNWGDAVTPVLVQWLAGRRPVPYDRVFNLRGHPVHAVVGSVLDGTAILSLEVWGAGFKFEGSGFLVPPRRIHAVRGPLTRRAILEQGIECPAVFGDPALLFPRLYTPKVERRWPLGVVPHFRDRDLPIVQRLRERDDVLVIDILGGIRDVPDQICACETVASSSLHGLILADAYGIPAVWVELSDRVRGGGFKFRDYFASCGMEGRERFPVGPGTSPRDIRERAEPYEPRVDLDALLRACPFRSEGSAGRDPFPAESGRPGRLGQTGGGREASGRSVRRERASEPGR